MKVWLVFENDYEGSFLLSVWSTEELANAAMEKAKLRRSNVPGFSVEAYEVDSGELA